MPESLCSRCLGPNVLSWHAPSPLWNFVMRDEATGIDRWDIVCPVCFSQLAEEAGLDYLVWHFGPHIPVEHLWKDKEGRVWNNETCLWE